jgi:sugar/nucleoside kinase (ribokinase family)
MTTVVTLGLQILDVLGRPVSHVPAGQHLALLDEIRMTVAGTAGGTAIDLAKLGAHVIAMGAIGTDEPGDFVVATYKKYGVETEHLSRKDGVQTSSSMLLIRPNGERPALHVIGANGELSFADIDLGIIGSADILHMGGTSLLPKLDGEPTVRVLEYAKSRGVTTTFDLVAIERPDLLDLIEPCLPYVDYFMPGFEEAVMMCGYTDRMDVIRFFLDRGARHTVFKMGGSGSSIAWLDGTKVREIRIPALQVPVVDSTGCGDAYCAGFIIGLSAGWDLERSGRLGTAAAGLVIQGLGSDAGIIDLPHTLAFMNESKAWPLDGGAGEHG